MAGVISRGRGRRNISEINMVPFIDVMLVLLIIFMVTAPLITPSIINLPKVGKASAKPQNTIQIEISKDEAVSIKVKSDATRSSITTVAADVIKTNPAVKASGEDAVPVVIIADKSLKYETVVTVMDKLQRAGVSRIAIAVQPGK